VRCTSAACGVHSDDSAPCRELLASTPLTGYPPRVRELLYLGLGPAPERPSMQVAACELTIALRELSAARGGKLC